MKNIGAYVTIGLTILGLAVAWGVMKANQETAKESIADHEVRLRSNEDIDIRQSVIQERTVEVLKQLEAKF